MPITAAQLKMFSMKCDGFTKTASKIMISEIGDEVASKLSIMVASPSLQFLKSFYDRGGC